MKYLPKLFRIFIIPLCFIFLHYGNNIGKVAIHDILLTLLITLVFCCLLFSVLLLITNSWENSALLSAIFFFLFFNFGNLSRILTRLQIFPKTDSHLIFSYQNSKILCLILAGILFGMITIVIMRQRNKQETYRRLGDFFSIGMIGVVVGSLFFSNLQTLRKPGETSSEDFYQGWQRKLSSEENLLHPSGQLPDIYYIILDGYGREDILGEIYGYDNQPFLAELKSLGFGLSEDSLSNYKQTDLTISSLLNIDYINWVGDKVGRQNTSYFPLYFLIDQNRVFTQLKRIGYRINTFTTGFEATEIETADVIFKPKNFPNSFEVLMINATPLSILWDSKLYAIHRERIRSNFQNLPEAGNQDGPDFVFLHILAPHPPFVFGPNGESVTPDRPFTNLDAAEFLELGTSEEYKAGYIDQLTYLNKEVLAAVQKIMQTSSIPPIIIIQGDHGPGMEFDHQRLENSNLAERYPILFASFLPCGTSNQFPQTITPVNTFRYIFNFCFNGSLPYLESRQFFSSSLTPYELIDVTDELAKSLQVNK